MTEEKKHPLGWACPDCESPLEPSYDDVSTGALYVCTTCLALISTEGATIKLIDYHDLDVGERCLFISGVTMMMTHLAMESLAKRAQDSEDH